MSQDIHLADRFICPVPSYHGEDPTFQKVAFSANLSEMATRLGFVAGLTSNGKISPDDAYKSARKHWKTLKKSAKSLGLKK
ncbi:hypothetical protein GC174_18260 [bacterium]|nr:hypothetical protein [bacterium]